MSKRFFLAALCGLPISFMATPAQAQVAKYCNDAFEAAGFYRQVQGNGVSSVVTYSLLLQNRTANPQRYTVRFTAPGAREAQSGSVVATALKYQTVTILLGRQHRSNPSGQDALSNADVARYTQVQCPPAQ